MTVEQMQWNSVAEERFRTTLVSTYSALAVVLSSGAVDSKPAVRCLADVKAALQ